MKIEIGPNLAELLIKGVICVTAIVIIYILLRM